MKTSELLKNKIKEYEGCRLRAYRCPAGVLTIGYGHTGSDVTDGKTITQNEADSLFDQDIERFERQLRSIIGTVNLSQCQWDALVSLAYNIGIGAFSRSTLLKKIRSNPDNPAIREEFLKWNKAGGRVLPGLVKRRLWESQRYFGEV
ncbi:MAG: lysozyme [Muribaculaceae bacterium]|nr:lysozyme [Muribaculaceae bacterium]